MRRPRRDSSGGGGINGSLTPARKRYPSGLANPSTPKHSESLAKNAGRALQYSSKNEGPPTWHGGHARGGEHSKGDGVGVGVGVDMGDRSASGAGISLHETEDRIRQLERAEFDLKMKLYYTEERLEEAAGGADVVQLHREVAHAKRHRAQAEESMRAATEEAKELRAKCESLDARCRDLEATLRAELEKQDAEEGEKLAKLRKHVRLLEDTLRAERAENARLRLTGTEPKPSSHSLDEFIEEGNGHMRRYSSRRKSTGDASEPGTAFRAASIGGREQRERHLTLEAKVKSQDSSMRSLRADITTLRRRLRTQAECLERQKLEMKALTQAAEQVACVEAEEIARLAVELEQAVGEAKSERQRRRTAEERLVTAQKRLLGRPSTPTAANRTDVRGGRPATTGAVPDRARSPSPSLRQPLASEDVRSPGRRANVAPTTDQQNMGKAVSVAARGRASVLGDDDEPRGGGGSVGNDAHGRSGERESKTVVPAKREMSSTVASRGRSITSPRNTDSVGVRGTVRDGSRTPTRDDGRSGRGAAGKEMASTIASGRGSSTSPRNRDSVGGRGTVRGRSGTPPADGSRGGGAADGKERRRPWGSPPPEPKIRRAGSLEHTFKPSDDGRQIHGRVSVSPERSATVAATFTTPRREDANTSHSPEENVERKRAAASRVSLGSPSEKGGARVRDGAPTPPRREIPKPKAGRRLSAGKTRPELSSGLTKSPGNSSRARPGDTAAGGRKDGGDTISSHESSKNHVVRRGSTGGVNAATASPKGRSDDERPEEGNHQGGNFGPEEVSNRAPQGRAVEEVEFAGGTGGKRRAPFEDEGFRWGVAEGDDGGGSGLDALTLSTMSADLTETVARELRLAVATSTTTPDTDATHASAFGGGTASQVLDVGFPKDNATLLTSASQRDAYSGQGEGAGASWERRESDGAGSCSCTCSGRGGGRAVGIRGDMASQDYAASSSDRRMSPQGDDTHLDWRHHPDSRGASRTSRGVAELESDVHNLVQFFAGRREAGLGGAGEVAALAAEARASAAIGQALALWGSRGN